MDLHAAKRGARLTVKMTGELDHHCAERARTTLDHMLRDISVRELVLDLSGLTFMDSAGLGVVLGRYRILNARGGCVMLFGVPRSIDRIFRMSGLYALCERL